MPMMNRRDQAQAYRFLTRRLSSALVRDAPDAPDAPMRKIGIASFSSVMVALLAVAVFGVIGLLHPGGATSWKNGQSLILEKETGTRYIYTGGELHPVLNYASARLALGQPALTIVSVSRASLRGTPRGLAIGIAGAPDDLPTPATLVTGPWSVCSLPSVDQAGAVHPYVRVSVGTGLGGGVLTGGHGLLVTGLDGTMYLVWNDHRLRIPGGASTLTALSYSSVMPLLVGDAWLSALPQGPDLAPPPVPGIGGPGPAVGGSPSQVGQVFVAAGSGTGGTGTGGTGTGGTGTAQYYVAMPGGLAPITLTQADLLLGDPATRPLYPAGRPAAIRVTAAEVAAAAPVPAPGPAALPARPPVLLDSGNGQLAACEVYAVGGDAPPAIRTFPISASAVPQASAGTPADALGAALADQVRMPPGRGAVVQAVDAPGVTGGTLYLVTDQGMKYPLTDSGLLAPLGLSGVTPAKVTSAVLQLLRTGPTLNQRAATLTVSP
jgi:type VII secretion protein EccB